MLPPTAMLCLLSVALLVGTGLAADAPPLPPTPVVIVAAVDDSRAAQDVQRYLYLQTGQLPGLLVLQRPATLATANATLREAARRAGLSGCTRGVRSAVCVVASTGSKLHTAARSLLPPEGAQHLDDARDFLASKQALHGNSHAHVTQLIEGGVESPSFLVCSGLDRQSTRHAAYTLVQRVTNVRFALHGDIIPDPSNRAPGGLCGLLASPRFTADHIGAYLATAVSVRGIQPFHDFSEGPDWWNADEYYVVLDQISKLKMNFIGLHTYPLAEPTVWTG